MVIFFSETVLIADSLDKKNKLLSMCLFKGIFARQLWSYFARSFQMEKQGIVDSNLFELRRSSVGINASMFSVSNLSISFSRSLFRIP